MDEEETAAKVLRAAGAVDTNKLNENSEAPKLDIVPPRDPDAGRPDMIYRWSTACIPRHWIAIYLYLSKIILFVFCLILSIMFTSGGKS